MPGRYCEHRERCDNASHVSRLGELNSSDFHGPLSLGTLFASDTTYFSTTFVNNFYISYFTFFMKYTVFFQKKLFSLKD